MPPSTPTGSEKLTHGDSPVEKNIESIRALEEQIREHEMAVIRLKRTRNSLLNVSRLPPEILGEIFSYNTALKAALPASAVKRSHNFLLVCHHWFKVASRTPELWSFWGHTVEDWTKRYFQHPTAPLHLVHDDGQFDFTTFTLDDGLRNALRDRAARNNIREIRLTMGDSGVMNSLISLLIGCEQIRSSRMESVVLRFVNPHEPPIVLDFLTCYRFPKLRCLHLENCTIPSWSPKTSVLTSLSLDGGFPSPMITSSQLLSVLRSNPRLQEIVLGRCAVPDDGGDESSRVPLANLTSLMLTGRPQYVFTLLHQLKCPRNMDNLFLDLVDSAVEDISRTIGPYLRNYFRRRGGSPSGLGLELSFHDNMELEFWIKVTSDLSDPYLESFPPFARIFIHLGQMLPEDLSDDGLFDLIAHVPREEITSFRANGIPLSMEVISTQFPSLSGLHFKETPLHIAFPKSNPGRGKIFPYLQHFRIALGDAVAMRRSDWNPLTTFLDRLASSGNRTCTLVVDGHYVIHPKVEERIRRAVREFRMTNCDEY